MTSTRALPKQLSLIDLASLPGIDPCILLMWAPWDENSEAADALLGKLQPEFRDLDFRAVDVGDETWAPWLAENGITTTPTFALYRKGRLMNLRKGFHSEDRLRELLRAWIAACDG